MLAWMTFSRPSLPLLDPCFSSTAELHPAMSAPAMLVPASAPAARPMNKRLVRRSSDESTSGMSPLLPLVDMRSAAAPLPRAPWTCRARAAVRASFLSSRRGRTAHADPLVREYPGLPSPTRRRAPVVRRAHNRAHDLILADRRAH